MSIYNLQHRGLGWALFVAYSYYMIQFHGIQNLPVDEVGTHMGYSGYSHGVLRLRTWGYSGCSQRVLRVLTWGYSGYSHGGTPGTHMGYSGCSRRGNLKDPVPRHPEPARRRGGVDTPEHARTRASAHGRFNANGWIDRQVPLFRGVLARFWMQASA
jgi:hypothetical protein